MGQVGMKIVLWSPIVSQLAKLAQLAFSDLIKVGIKVGRQVGPKLGYRESP